MLAEGPDGFEKLGLVPEPDPYPAPRFTSSRLNGKPLGTEEVKGKLVLLNFWATWCPPCLHEIPSLNRLVRKMQGKPLRLVSIDFGEPQKNVTDFLKKVQVDFPVLLDSDGSISNAWKVVVLPSTFVIGKDGRIVYGINASIEWDSPEIIALLNKLMLEE